MNTKKKRESQYVDGLDQEELDLIKNIQEPWEKAFIVRFYSQLAEKNLSKKDICDKVRKQNKKYIGNYVLNESTLSQYTNYKNEKGLRPLSVNALISISNALDVSIDYLLGIEESERHDLTDIYKKTGLERKSVEALKSNIDSQNFINVLLKSDNLNILLMQMKQIFYAEFISPLIMSAYSKELVEIIDSSFKKFMDEVVPIEYQPKTFAKYFQNEFTYKHINIDENYIKKNVILQDRINQIRNTCKWENLDLRNAFIKDTVSCVYEIMLYTGSSDYYKNKVSHTFLKIIDEFFDFKKHSLFVKKS